MYLKIGMLGYLASRRSDKYCAGYVLSSQSWIVPIENLHVGVWARIYISKGDVQNSRSEPPYIHGYNPQTLESKSWLLGRTEVD
jgi:hypothetical protein